MPDRHFANKAKNSFCHRSPVGKSYVFSLIGKVCFGKIWHTKKFL